jgi:hypothetical protein
MIELLIIGAAIQVMVWTSILMYRLAKNYVKKLIEKNNNDEELPPYEPPPPPYTDIISNEHLVSQ